MYVCVCMFVCLFVYPVVAEFGDTLIPEIGYSDLKAQNRLRRLCHSKAGSQRGPCPMWAGPSVGGALPVQCLGTWQGMHVLKQG